MVGGNITFEVETAEEEEVVVIEGVATLEEEGPFGDGEGWRVGGTRVAL